MVISICAATKLELEPIKKRLLNEPLTSHEVHFFVTGVGMLQSCFHIQQHQINTKPELIILLGIAGSFNKDLTLGSAVIIEKEYLGSMGVQENNGNHKGWQDIFDLGLQDPDQSPFKAKALENPWINNWPWIKEAKIPLVRSITIDEISSSKKRISQLAQHYQPALESMEGASLHYCCLNYQTAFIQIRGISNFVGERDKSNWQIGPALKAVTETAVDFLRHL